MLTVAYRFHVLPRHHDHFRHAWHAAQDTLQQIIGLQSCQLHIPQHRRQPFILVLSWDKAASFNRFTRTWVGVWAINGMGLQREDFFAPTQTCVEEAQPARLDPIDLSSKTAESPAHDSENAGALSAVFSS